MVRTAIFNSNNNNSNSRNDFATITSGELCTCSSHHLDGLNAWRGIPRQFLGNIVEVPSSDWQSLPSCFLSVPY